jgi:hypothetical protein
MARKSEIDLSRYDWTRATRGRYVEKARRALEVIGIDKKSAKALGGPEGIRRILLALAQSIEPRRKKRRAAA